MNEHKRKIILEIAGRQTAFDLARPTSIAMPLEFDGPQPNPFGVQPASREVLELDGFVGSTKRGGGCNVDSIRLIPHCNGTHTETVGHIVDEPVFIAEHALNALVPALLLTVEIEAAAESGDSYRPDFEDGDAIISQSNLHTACGEHKPADYHALILRTKPNSPESTPFLSIEAMAMIVESEVEHLLVDLPSVDRLADGGLLANHHLYWNVPEGTNQLDAGTQIKKTITELVSVADHLNDGCYLLNLQIPPFCSDAAPSRPILYPIFESDPQ